MPSKHRVAVIFASVLLALCCCELVLANLAHHPVPVFLTVRDDCELVKGGGESTVFADSASSSKKTDDSAAFLNRLRTVLLLPNLNDTVSATGQQQAKPVLKLYEKTVKRFGCSAVVSGFVPASLEDLRDRAAFEKKRRGLEEEEETSKTDSLEIDTSAPEVYSSKALDADYVIHGALTRSTGTRKRSSRVATLVDSDAGERVLLARELIAKQYRIEKSRIKKPARDGGAKSRRSAAAAADTGTLFLDYNFRVAKTPSTVEQLDNITIGPDAFVPWHLDRLTAPANDQLYTLPSLYIDTSRPPARIYIVDTGVSPTHQEFLNATSGLSRVHLLYDAYPAFDLGCDVHGTHVAALAGGNTVGVNSNSQIYTARALDCSGSGTFNEVVAALYAIHAHCSVNANNVGSVINLSLGGGSIYNVDLVQSLSNAFNALRTECDMFIAVSAGNSAQDACTILPAALVLPEQGRVFTVGASTATDDYATFTNWGACVAINSPGKDIYSAVSVADNAYGILSGTSMASPIVAGVASLHMQQRPLNWFSAASTVSSDSLLFTDAVRIKMLTDASTAMKLFTYSSSTTDRLVQITTPLTNYTSYVPPMPPFNGNLSEIIYVPDPPVSRKSTAVALSTRPTLGSWVLACAMMCVTVIAFCTL